MTFADFVKSANDLYDSKKPELRYGQALFTQLATVRPDIADALIGTTLDPYYGSVVSPDTWTFICDRW